MIKNPICRCGRSIDNLPDCFKDLGIWVCKICGNTDRVEHKRPDRICCKCGVPKPLTSEHFMNGSAQGFANECKVCYAKGLPARSAAARRLREKKKAGAVR